VPRSTFLVTDGPFKRLRSAASCKGWARMQDGGGEEEGLAKGFNEAKNP
jgi:hypothetical protein